MDSDSTLSATEPQPHAVEPGRVGRRGLMTGLAVGGAAVGGGAIGALTGQAFGGSPFRRETLAVEVACLGPTWREAKQASPADDADFRTPFSVEGWIYPSGTIPGDGFIPTEEQSIGRWFCRGWLLIDGLRSIPHVLSHQDYMFGTITREDPFPQHMITTTGLEGTDEVGIVSTRAVCGGTGRYLGATGAQRHWFTGPNASLLYGTTDNANNFACEFDLWVLS